jgi:alkanesulfonate monooxygenase SsuD/methylene tetrahydromethanopterin reductase-like flavin-dependent oxidoreductase (luciferase family)
LATRVAASHGQLLETQRDAWIIGTPPEVIEQLGRFINVGVSHCIFHSSDPFDMTPFRLFHDQVLPAFT